MNTIVPAVVDVPMTNTMRVEAARHDRRPTHRGFVVATRTCVLGQSGLSALCVCARWRLGDGRRRDWRRALAIGRLIPRQTRQYLKASAAAVVHELLGAEGGSVF